MYWNVNTISKPCGLHTRAWHTCIRFSTVGEGVFVRFKWHIKFVILLRWLSLSNSWHTPTQFSTTGEVEFVKLRWRMKFAIWLRWFIGFVSYLYTLRKWEWGIVREIYMTHSVCDMIGMAYWVRDIRIHSSVNVGEVVFLRLRSRIEFARWLRWLIGFISVRWLIAFVTYLDKVR